MASGPAGIGTLQYIPYGCLRKQGKREGIGRRIPGLLEALFHPEDIPPAARLVACTVEEAAFLETEPQMHGAAFFIGIGDAAIRVIISLESYQVQ